MSWKTYIHGTKPVPAEKNLSTHGSPELRLLFHEISY
jgi:hypothetical protein